VAKQLDMKALAERGAAVRISELQAEIDAIVATFPGLRSNSRGNGAVQRADDAPRRRRRTMTAAQRKAVSARMKSYLAQRRKAKSAAK
jgi:hypothetical protein